MDGLLDGGSSRRGSLTSLHRQPSGSFSHGLKLSTTAGGLQQANNTNLNNLHKDLDKFARYFIIKTVQVIVQSRIGDDKKVKTECKPAGNDWFNINISDIPEVSDRTKAALDADGFSIRSNWRVCCEISLKTGDGGRIVLEHWIISNKSNLTSSQNHLPSKLSQSSPKSPHQPNRLSPIHLSTSNNGFAPPSAINSPSTTRARPATFSNTMRTRLNSIDDNNFSNELLVGAINENIDIKPSASCFSLSTTSVNQTTDPTSTVTASPSFNSLSNNAAQGVSNNTVNNPASLQNQQQQQGSKPSALSSIYTIYNKMSLLLKTLMTTTHIVPTYRLASKTSEVDPSCVISYRVYTSAASYQNPKTNTIVSKGSLEDIRYNLNNESPNKRSSSSNSSFGSVNIREFVGPDELDHFCPILKIGSIKTDINELDVSLCYRTDVKNSDHLVRSARLYNKILDEDCITAAKQLLAGNDYTGTNHNEHHKHAECFKGDPCCRENCKNEALSYIDQPLRPAFASREQKTDKNTQDSNMVIIESAFDGLLQINDRSSNGTLIDIGHDTINQADRNMCKISSNGESKSANSPSKPIQVPSRPRNSTHAELYQNLSPSSTPKSLTDSFVFVDLNPPFASEEQNDINSFFHGPSPAFINGFDHLKDVDELTHQLAVIEANASQLDEFVDNICVSEDEEEEGER